MNKISEELIQASTAKVPTLNPIHFLLKTMSVLSSRSVETMLFFVLDSSSFAPTAVPYCRVVEKGWDVVSICHHITHVLPRHYCNEIHKFKSIPPRVCHSHCRRKAHQCRSQGDLVPVPVTGTKWPALT
jgi:hypothetical protein